MQRRPSKPMIAVSHPPQRAISFQDTSYEYLTCRRPKSGNIAVLSPHRPRIRPHAPADLTTVILGFADRGSAGSQVDVVGRLVAPYAFVEPDRLAGVTSSGRRLIDEPSRGASRQLRWSSVPLRLLISAALTRFAERSHPSADRGRRPARCGVQPLCSVAENQTTPARCQPRPHPTRAVRDVPDRTRLRGGALLTR